MDGAEGSRHPWTLPSSFSHSEPLPHPSPHQPPHSFLPLLQGLQEEGLDLGAQVEATRSLIQDNPNHQHKMDQLSADYQALHRSLEVRSWPRVCAPGI